MILLSQQWLIALHGNQKMAVKRPGNENYAGIPPFCVFLFIDTMNINVNKYSQDFSVCQEKAFSNGVLEHLAESDWCLLNLAKTL